MGTCILCGGQTSFVGTCKNCGFDSNLSKKKNGQYEFIFKGNYKVIIPSNSKMSLEEFAKKNKDKILSMLEEQKMASIGYFKGKMCPFTQVAVGGTKTTTFAITGASINEMTWTHSQCIEEYCALWDSKKKQCSIKTIAENLNKIKEIKEKQYEK